MGVQNCHNFQDFRKLAKRRLPSPIFHYIDGAADDEITYARNTSAFDDVDLVPNVLAGVEEVDMSVEVMGQKLDMPIYCAPTALQRLFHHEGERAVGKAATKHGTMFGVSSLATVTVEEIAKIAPGPKMFQFYFHKDRGLNDALRFGLPLLLPAHYPVPDAVRPLVRSYRGEEDLVNTLRSWLLERDFLPRRQDAPTQLAPYSLDPLSAQLDRELRAILSR